MTYCKDFWLCCRKPSALQTGKVIMPLSTRPPKSHVTFAGIPSGNKVQLRVRHSRGPVPPPRKPPRHQNRLRLLPNKLIKQKIYSQLVSDSVRHLNKDGADGGAGQSVRRYSLFGPNVGPEWEHFTNVEGMRRQLLKSSRYS